MASKTRLPVRVKRYRIELSGRVRVSPGSDRIADIPDWQLRANFGREPAFLLRGLSYMRIALERADSPQERIGGGDGGGS